MLITSKDNKTLKLARGLSEKKIRDKSGAFLVEGARAVGDVLSFRPELVDSVLVAESKAAEWADALVVTDTLFKNISETVSSQGVAAIVRKPTGQPSGCDHALFLDGIRDPGNLGTIIRTACAAGYDDIYLRDCADPYSGKTVRSTMSAIVKVNLVSADTETLTSLQSDGYSLIGADMGGRSIFRYTAPEKLCLIVGGEANGITSEVLEKCNELLSVPMIGTIESLNAAVSGAILMYNLKFNK